MPLRNSRGARLCPCRPVYGGYLILFFSEWDSFVIKSSRRGTESDLEFALAGATASSEMPSWAATPVSVISV